MTLVNRVAISYFVLDNNLLDEIHKEPLTLENLMLDNWKLSSVL